MGAFVDKTLETFELMAVAITELRQRVEALESVNADRSAQKTSKLRPLTEVRREAMNPPTEVPPHSHTHPDETDRSHVVSVGESHYHL